MYNLIKKYLLILLKVSALGFIGAMIAVQVPELLYDLGSNAPVSISGPEALTKTRFPSTTFVSIKGKPGFEQAFIYKRYGLSYTYFNIEPYGMRLVVRTYEKVTDEWKTLKQFLGKLQSFERQPFHYKIRDIYKEKFQADVPENAFFLALDDVPRLSGWQVAAIIFASLLWLLMFYMFFFFRRR